MSDDAYAFNPFDPNETQHMWDLMARMRAECPVSRPVEGFAYVARYADNVEVFRDAKRFSSAEGFRGAGGFRLSDVFVRTLAVNTLAGSLSTTYLLGNLMYRFVTEPQSFTHVLRADPAKIPVAVEESLRVEPPVLFLFRTATSATTVGGCPVAAGERLITGIASANRDESVYERADEFRLDRPPGEPEHLAFGVGPHICLGNHLTRVEARVVLEELLARFGPDGPHGLHLAPGYQKTLVPMFLEYGPATLDVVVTS
jgi:cytochrome P450